MLFYTRYLGLSDTTATILQHASALLHVPTIIFGAFIADSWLEVFYTILIGRCIAFVANGLRFLGAIPPLNAGIPLVMAALTVFLFVSFMGPAAGAIIGNQFILPQQKKQLTNYYTIQYFTNNVSGCLGTIIGPILRQDFRCFGQPECYAVAYGIPLGMNVVSLRK